MYTRKVMWEFRVDLGEEVEIGYQTLRRSSNDLCQQVAVFTDMEPQFVYAANFINEEGYKATSYESTAFGQVPLMAFLWEF